MTQPNTTTPIADRTRLPGHYIASKYGEDELFTPIAVTRQLEQDLTAYQLVYGPIDAPTARATHQQLKKMLDERTADLTAARAELEALAKVAAERLGWHTESRRRAEKAESELEAAQGLVAQLRAAGEQYWLTAPFGGTVEAMQARENLRSTLATSPASYADKLAVSDASIRVAQAYCRDQFSRANTLEADLARLAARVAELEGELPKEAFASNVRIIELQQQLSDEREAVRVKDQALKETQRRLKDSLIMVPCQSTDTKVSTTRVGVYGLAEDINLSLEKALATSAAIVAKGRASQP